MNEPGIGYRTLTSRRLLLGTGDGDALQNVIPTPIPDGALVFVRDQAALYRLDKFSTVASSPPEIVATIFGRVGAGSLGTRHGWSRRYDGRDVRVDIGRERGEHRRNDQLRAHRHGRLRGASRDRALDVRSYGLHERLRWSTSALARASDDEHRAERRAPQATVR